jgi:hypothetical protein
LLPREIEATCAALHVRLAGFLRGGVVPVSPVKVRGRRLLQACASPRSVGRSLRSSVIRSRSASMGVYMSPNCAMADESLSRSPVTVSTCAVRPSFWAWSAEISASAWASRASREPSGATEGDVATWSGPGEACAAARAIAPGAIASAIVATSAGHARRCPAVLLWLLVLVTMASAAGAPAGPGSVAA